MAKFNRAIQLKILESAVDHYPDQIHPKNVPSELQELDDKTLVQNIFYLQEEGLIRGGTIHTMQKGTIPNISMIQATKDAVNLLSEDGSISESLKVVTIKLHDDSLSAIREFINQNVSDPEEKKAYLQRLKELPADATKHIVLELLGKGLGQIPNAVHWLQTALHQA